MLAQNVWGQLWMEFRSVSTDTSKTRIWQYHIYSTTSNTRQTSHMKLSASLYVPLYVALYLLNQCAGLFNPYVDIYAKPQFQISLPQRIQTGKALDGYISHADAEALRQVADSENALFQIQEMKLDGQDYVCTLPILDEEPYDPAVNALTNAQEKIHDDLVRSQAKSKALELLEPLTQTCLYYSESYFLYALCYGRYITQFHPAPFQVGQEPVPEEGTARFVLGRFDTPESVASVPMGERTDVTVQSSGAGTNYFSHRLGGGTVCDITGLERTVEVQFHCNHKIPTDKIAWIKEVKTCHYEIAVYTPRLCSELAFASPKEQNAHNVVCRLVVEEDELAELRARVKQPSLELPGVNSDNADEITEIGNDDIGESVISDSEIDHESQHVESHKEDLEKVQDHKENDGIEAEDVDDSVENELQPDENQDMSSDHVNAGQEAETEGPPIDYKIAYFGSKIQMDIPPSGNVVDDLRKALNVLLEDVLDQIESGKFKVDDKVVTMDDEFMTLVSLVDPSGQLFANLLISFEKEYLRLELISDDEVNDYEQALHLLRQQDSDQPPQAS
jgi:Glucosidase II beta subunit-like protein